jgi:glycosyltransferase involved in cell wall biosynthesis
MKNKKTPFIVLASPVLLQGGTEYQMLSVIRALKDEGYRLGVICYYEYNPAIVDLFKAEGVEITLLELKREAKKGLRSLLRLFWVLLKWFCRNKPDVVNIQYLAPGLIPILAAKIALIKRIFATIHISGSHAYGKKAKSLFKISSFLVDHFICVSQGTEKFWFGSCYLFTENTILKKHKHFTIYNAIDTERINRIVNQATPIQTLKHYCIPENRFIIGVVGRLAEQKGHRVLFEALALVKQADVDFILLVIGNGPLEEELKKLSIDLGIQDHLLWLGSNPQDEVFRLYGIMDILVMPSIYEGFGLVAAEAMGAGVPVIASEVDGLSEVVVHNVSGILVQPGNVTELYKQLIFLHGNRVLLKQYSRTATTIVLEKFNVESFQQKCKLLYRTSLKKANG